MALAWVGEESEGEWAAALEEWAVALEEWAAALEEWAVEEQAAVLAEVPAPYPGD